MFGLPEAKRVRREDLDGFSSSGSSSHDDERTTALRAQLDAQLASKIALHNFSLPSEVQPAKSSHVQSNNDVSGKGGDVNTRHNDGGGEKFEFRLFSTQGSAVKVVLEGDEPSSTRNGGIVGPGRPLSYYVAGEATAEQKAQFQAAAITGDDVLARSQQRWWGMEMPWRVTSVAATKAEKKLSGGGTEAAADEQPAQQSPKKRPGKTKRIALRRKLRAASEKDAEAKRRKEEEEKQKVAKEEHMLEKKRRLNRERKLKRRAKDKEKKVAARTMVNEK